MPLGGRGGGAWLSCCALWVRFGDVGGILEDGGVLGRKDIEARSVGLDIFLAKQKCLDLEQPV